MDCKFSRVCLFHGAFAKTDFFLDVSLVLNHEVNCYAEPIALRNYALTKC